MRMCSKQVREGAYQLQRYRPLVAVPLDACVNESVDNQATQFARRITFVTVWFTQSGNQAGTFDPLLRSTI